MKQIKKILSKSTESEFSTLKNILGKSAEKLNTFEDVDKTLITFEDESDIKLARKNGNYILSANTNSDNEDVKSFKVVSVDTDFEEKDGSMIKECWDNAECIETLEKLNIEDIDFEWLKSLESNCDTKSSESDNGDIVSINIELDFEEEEDGKSLDDLDIKYTSKFNDVSDVYDMTLTSAKKNIYTWLSDNNGWTDEEIEEEYPNVL